MWNSALKVLWAAEKEMRIEFRTKYALNAMMLFCVTCVAMASFALGGRVDDPRMQSALLWILIFFAAMSGLSRSFVKEHEIGTIRLLQVVCDPIPIFFGKVLFNLLLLGAMLVVLGVMFPMFLQATPKNWGYFIGTAALASISISILSTTISAIVAGARVRGTLFPILSFPVLLPVFIIAVQATRLSYEGVRMPEAQNYVIFLAAYAGISAIVCTFLFEILFYE